jgi:hypothetical protein
MQQPPAQLLGGVIKEFGLIPHDQPFGFGAFQNRPMPAKQNQSTPHVIKIGT